MYVSIAMAFRNDSGVGAATPLDRASGPCVIWRVVLFEGVPPGLHVYSRAFHDAGYLVDEASDWSQLANLLRLRPNVVLVDLEAKRPLGGNKAPRGTFAFPFEGFPPIVGIGERGRGAEIGLAACVAKPIDVGVLLGVLEQVVLAEQRRRGTESAIGWAR